MGNGFGKLKTFSSLKELESATGERFEMYAQYMLSLIHSSYIGTRIHKDNGIDGILLSRESSREDTVIYSIYGPEKGTGWSSKFSKIKDDIDRIKEYVDGKFVKYTVCFVFNFKLAGEEIAELNKYCTTEGITYDLLYPDRLFGKLEDNTKLIVNAIAFLDGVEADTNELTDWNNHIFAGKILEILCHINEGEDTATKLKAINALQYNLLSYLPLKVLKLVQDPYKADLFIVPSKKALKQSTVVNQGCTTVYIYEKKTSEIKKLTEKEYENMFGINPEYIPTVSKMDKNIYSIKIENLYIIFFLLNQCYGSLENSGEFSLSKALTIAEYLEIGEMLRLQKKAK